MNKIFIKFILLLLPLLLQALTFKVASYNVENLFDMQYSGHEYKEYIPNSKYGWNQYTYQKKLQNISKVIYDLKPDIISLEEVESKTSLLDLRKYIKKRGLDYKYFAIADKKNSTVKVAVLSRFKIVKTKELRVTYQNRYRNILEVHLLVGGKKLLLFVNHWKSKSSPESYRIKYAKVLRKRIDTLPKDTDYIILGDFNSNYNEYITIRHHKKLNDTNGKTGINDILKTIYHHKMVDVNMLKHNCNLLYNLWLELPIDERFSYIYQGEKDTIDNIILPCGMFDGKNIEYIKHSFGVFKPSYLFKNGSIYKWERRYGYGKFTGFGYSDHLPIYAYFSTDRHDKKPMLKVLSHKKYTLGSIKELYHLKDLNKQLLLKNCVVIQKDKFGCTIKRLKDRAIYIFHHNKLFKKGYIYNLIINGVNNYKGNLEIDSFVDINRIKIAKNLKYFYLQYKKGMDLSKKIYLNEIIYRINGIFKNGYLYYDKNNKIKIYNKTKNYKIQNGAYLKLKFVRIASYKGNNEIIISKKNKD